jgi:hypothetical protein
MSSMSAHLSDLSNRDINVIGDLRSLTRIPAVRDAIEDYVGHKCNLALLEATHKAGVFISDDRFAEKRDLIQAADDRCRDITGWCAADLIVASGVPW